MEKEIRVIDEVINDKTKERTVRGSCNHFVKFRANYSLGFCFKCEALVLDEEGY